MNLISSAWSTVPTAPDQLRAAGKVGLPLTDTGWLLFKLTCDAESGRIEAFIDDM
jgi:hypothetical protein